jgi:hypothetical protein
MTITANCGTQEQVPVIHEFLAVGSRRAEVYKLNLCKFRLASHVKARNYAHFINLLIIQEIAPVRVGLHKTQVKELAEAQG